MSGTKIYKKIKWDKLIIPNQENEPVYYLRVGNAITFETPVVNIPFGVETRENGTSRITLEYSPNSSCFRFLKDLEVQVEKKRPSTMFKSVLMEGYKTFGPLQTRVKLKKDKFGMYETEFKDPQGFFTESSKIKGRRAKVTLRLMNVWDKDGKSGVNWEALSVSLVS